MNRSDSNSPDGLHRAILASALDPLVVIDSLGEIVVSSDSVERLFGYHPDELVGRNIRVLMPEPHRSAHDEYLAHYRRTGKTNILNRTRLFTVLRKDGSPIEVELSVARVELGTERPPLFIGSFRDVSARLAAERAAQRSEQRLQAVFDRSFEYMGLLSPDGTLLEVNQAALQATGIQRADVIGRPFWETRWWSESEEVRERLRRSVELAAKGEFVRFETTHPGADGEQLTVDFSLSPVKDSEGQVVLLVPEGRDITALKQAQASETAMLRSLAEIGESAAILAHEIKNPITSVNAALRAVAGKLGADEQAVLEDLSERMQRLERVMRRTLSFSRPLKLERKACNAGELVESTLHELRPAAREASVTLEIERSADDLALVADPQLIGEVLTNLVNNAIEVLAERGGGLVRASVEALGDTLLFCVDDDGPGIPARQRELVFKPFHTTKSSGSGLGLALCRKIALAHDGTLDFVESALGGVAFALELPKSGSVRPPSKPVREPRS